MTWPLEDEQLGSVGIYWTPRTKSSWWQCKMAHPGLTDILDADHQNLGVYYRLGEKNGDPCTKSRFPSPTFLTVKAFLSSFFAKSEFAYRKKALHFHHSQHLSLFFQNNLQSLLTLIQSEIKLGVTSSWGLPCPLK